MKTSEEAACSMSDNCKYTFSSTVPQVSALAPEWDASSNTWTVKVSGTGFTGDTSTSELSILGKVQKPVAVLSSVAVFRVTDVWFGNATNMNLYFDIGTPGPAGWKNMSAAGVLLTPKFVGLLTKTGSPGGSTIVLNVQGIGRNDTIKKVQYQGSGGGWNDLCT